MSNFGAEVLLENQWGTNNENNGLREIPSRYLNASLGVCSLPVVEKVGVENWSDGVVLYAVT